MRLEFKDQVESQDELSDLVSKCFPNDENMDYSQFITTVEKVSSDIFLFVKYLLKIDNNTLARKKTFL